MMKKTLFLLAMIVVMVSCTTVKLQVSAPNVMVPVSLSNYVSINKDENTTRINKFSTDATTFNSSQYYNLVLYYVTVSSFSNVNFIEQDLTDYTEGSKYNALKNVVVEGDNNQLSMNVLYFALINNDSIHVKLSGDIVNVNKEESK
jgi:hypothetical protein